MANILDSKRLITYPQNNWPEGDWHADVINFDEGGTDVSGYGILKIRVRGEVGGERIKIQLIDNFEDVNFSQGLWPKTGSPGKQLSRVLEDIKIPLSEFEGVNLKKIVRISIHHGKKAWNETLNNTNTNQIVVEKIEFER